MGHLMWRPAGEVCFIVTSQTNWWPHSPLLHGTICYHGYQETWPHLTVLGLQYYTLVRLLCNLSLSLWLHSLRVFHVVGTTGWLAGLTALSLVAVDRRTWKIDPGYQPFWPASHSMTQAHQTQTPSGDPKAVMKKPSGRK